MIPIPLTSPTGALYGYACGACHQLGSTWETLNDTGAPLPEQVEASREHAAE